MEKTSCTRKRVVMPVMEKAEGTRLESCSSADDVSPASERINRFQWVTLRRLLRCRGCCSQI